MTRILGILRNASLTNVSSSSSRERESERLFFFFFFERERERKSGVGIRRYAASLRRETEAFERLVQEKRVLIVPSPQQRSAQREAEAASRELRFKEATGKRKAALCVVVDSREFRAPLPSQLHARGCRLLPATLTVGDYVLAPELVVERKSVADLVSSLQSGRLFTQAEAMLAAYATSLLLIETTDSLCSGAAAAAKACDKAAADREKKSGRTPPRREDRSVQDLDLDSLAPLTSIEARLALLAMAFPRLRFLWARDTRATAELFTQLKRGREEPVVTACVEHGSARLLEDQDDTGRNAALELLRKLPGVNDRNVRALVERVDSLQDLAQLTTQDLWSILGKANATKLHDFLHAAADDATHAPHAAPGNRPPPLKRRRTTRQD